MNPFILNITTIQTATSIYSYVRSCLESNVPQVKEDIQSLDVERRVRLIETLLRDLYESPLRKNGSMMIAIENLEDSLRDINRDMSLIEKKVRDYKSSWISLGSFSVEKEVKAMKRHLNILTERFQLFTNISSILASHKVDDMEESMYIS